MDDVFKYLASCRVIDENLCLYNYNKSSSNGRDQYDEYIHCRGSSNIDVEMNINFNISYSDGKINCKKLIINQKSKVKSLKLTPNIIIDSEPPDEETDVILYDFPKLACGYNHTLAIHRTGKLWICGSNLKYQLGIPDQNTDLVKVLQEHPSDKHHWVKISAGSYHTIGITLNEELIGCGYNNKYQLGNRSHGGDFVTEFRPITYLNGWIDVACGIEHSVFLRKDGTIWGCGSNSFGQLGFPSNNSEIKYVKQITVDGVPDNNWKYIACGAYHTMLIASDGSLWGCGRNNSGQLGTGENYDKYEIIQIDSLYNWQKVSCGYGHTIALDFDRQVFATGLNNYGQLGTGDTQNRNKLTDFADRKYTDFDFPNSNRNVHHIECGLDNTFVIQDNKKIYGTGRNDYYQLGIGDNNHRNKYTEILIPLQDNRFGREDKYFSFQHTIPYSIAAGGDFTLFSIPIQISNVHYPGYFIYNYISIAGRGFYNQLGFDDPNSLPVAMFVPLHTAPLHFNGEWVYANDIIYRRIFIPLVLVEDASVSLEIYNDTLPEFTYLYNKIINVVKFVGVSALKRSYVEITGGNNFSVFAFTSFINDKTDNKRDYYTDGYSTIRLAYYMLGDDSIIHASKVIMNDILYLDNTHVMEFDYLGSTHPIVRS
jgi:alpha-tubulin suppressor-like RCC1 family protein